MSRRLPSLSGAGQRMAVKVTGALLVVAGAGSIGVAAASQHHAPQPGRAQAGTVSPSTTVPRRALDPRSVSAPASSSVAASETTVHGPVLARSVPVSISIPSIGVHSSVFQVGLNPDGTIQVPPLSQSPLTNEAAWYKYSPTPGQPGPAIVEGHIDSAAQGPSVFYRLGALRPGDVIDVGLQDGVEAVFKVSGVREYRKSAFPTATVYGNADYAGLRLVTCGGSFDSATGHYLSNTVVYASLVGSDPAGSARTP